VRADDELPKVTALGHDGMIHRCEVVYQATADTVCGKTQLGCHIFEWPYSTQYQARPCPECYRKVGDER
jgi:hypothetical protein